jgi:hypothetical protein
MTPNSISINNSGGIASNARVNGVIVNNSHKTSNGSNTHNLNAKLRDPRTQNNHFTS